MTSAFSFTACLLYLMATIVMIRSLRVEPVRGKHAAVDLLLVYLAVIAHVLSLSPSVLLNETPDLALGTTLSLISLLAMLLFLLARLFQPIHSLGVFIYPAALAGALIGWLAPGPAYASNLGGALGLLHVAGAGLAYALISLAFAQALLVHAYDRSLKHPHTAGNWHSLPPIQTMERVLFQLIYLGFGLLTITLVSGALSADKMFGEAFLFNHHTVLALLAWISLAGLLAGRIFFGWRGRTAVLWTGAGFTLMALGYFGTRFVLEVLLGT
jgi:ABC-type uncharacterized transport system permease subunit